MTSVVLLVAHPDLQIDEFDQGVLPQPRIRFSAVFICCVVAFVRMKSDFKEMGEVIPRGTQKTAGFLSGFTTMNGFRSFTLPFPRITSLFILRLSCGYSGFQNCLLYFGHCSAEPLQ